MKTLSLLLLFFIGCAYLFLCLLEGRLQFLHFLFSFFHFLCSAINQFFFLLLLHLNQILKLLLIRHLCLALYSLYRQYLSYGFEQLLNFLQLEGLSKFSVSLETLKTFVNPDLQSECLGSCLLFLLGFACIDLHSITFSTLIYSYLYCQCFETFLGRIQSI